MKKVKILIGLIVITASLLQLSCVKHEMLPPPLALYKTNPEYFDFMAAWISNSGKSVAGYPYYKPTDPRILFTADDTIYTLRAQLNDGYVLSNEVFFTAPFTDVSFKEFVRRQDSDSPIRSEIMYDRILDRNPFREYYEVDTEFLFAFQTQLRDSAYSGAMLTYLTYQKAGEEINIMISEGKLEENFLRIK